MKVYVDELPKSCSECPCCNNCCDYGTSCNITQEEVSLGVFLRGKLKSCPLQSLADYTKQVRREVCEKITEELLDISHEYWKTFLRNGVQYMTSDDLYELLEEITKQIQGE